MYSYKDTKKNKKNKVILEKKLIYQAEEGQTEFTWEMSKSLKKLLKNLQEICYNK